MENVFQGLANDHDLLITVERCSLCRRWYSITFREREVGRDLCNPCYVYLGILNELKSHETVPWQSEGF